MTTIATWNVNSLRVRLPQLVQWLQANPVDLIALQETKLTDPDFPHQELESLGFTVACSGQRTYNGVAILARGPLQDVMTDMPGYVDPQRRLLTATFGGVRIVNVYVPNGQSVDSDKYRYKLEWLAALEVFVEGELARHPRLVLLGDFNVAPEDRDVHDPSAWIGSVLVSPAERAALARLTGRGLSDCFRRFAQPDQTFSWWDYRQAAYRRNRGVRIDLILASPAMAAVCAFSRIDREPRAWERPSDHAPCSAGFDI